MVQMDPSGILQPSHTALLVIDFQERLIPAMDKNLAETAMKNTQILIMIFFSCSTVHVNGIPKRINGLDMNANVANWLI